MSLSKFKFIPFLLVFALYPAFASSQQQEPVDPRLLDLLEIEESEEEPDSVIIIEEEYNPFADFLTDTIDEMPIIKELPLIPESDLPLITYMPVVFDYAEYIDTIAVTDPSPILASENSSLDWLTIEADRHRRFRDIKRHYMINHPQYVKYNIMTLPAPPKQYKATVDPSQSTIIISEVITLDNKLKEPDTQIEIERRHWLHNFSAGLQFSQAYISPNWYQGGNNNVNMIGNVRWNVKLNDKFHPNLIAEATTQYKLAISSAPNDSVHNYLISEDLFQFNGTFGVRAINNWYYSANAMFKTQFFNSYKSNSRDLKSAFLSPGELNVGLGMTYSKENKPKRFRIEVSISPLSYNMKMSTNSRINVTNFGIKEGHRTISEVGSNAEMKMTWNIMWNITYNSRIFLFTDYDYAQGDWENTLNFSINRYLSTQLYVHLRYDSSRDKVDDSRWSKWQLKEILSFGLQYQFKTI